MAQVLKDTQRDLILNAAKKEFAKNGIAGSSVRKIAKNADMAVGNLYHYFRTKEDIVNALIDPVLVHLSDFDSFMPTNHSSSHEQALRETGEVELNFMLESWVDNLVEAQDNFNEEMHIIVNDDKINSHYTDKLVLLIVHILTVTLPESVKSEEGGVMLARMVANSALYGLREGLLLKWGSDMSKEEFRSIMRHYIRHAFSALK